MKIENINISFEINRELIYSLGNPSQVTSGGTTILVELDGKCCSFNTLEEIRNFKNKKLLILFCLLDTDVNLKMLARL